MYNCFKNRVSPIFHLKIIREYGDTYHSIANSVYFWNMNLLLIKEHVPIGKCTIFDFKNYNFPLNLHLDYPDRDSPKKVTICMLLLKPSQSYITYRY